MKYFVALLALVVTMGCSGQQNPVTPSDITPTITLFAADSNRLSFTGGQTTMLRWEVTDVAAKVRIDPYPGNVPAVGSAAIVPTSTGTLNFTLTATNAFGSTQRFVTVTVN
jgi:hypothetical protein